MNDPFSVLGVSRGATEDEIKAAYRKLAKKYHPDLNPGDQTAERKMREINEAYAEALRIKRTGTGSASGYGNGAGGYGSSSGGYGGYGGGNTYGSYNGGNSSYNQNRDGYSSSGQGYGGNGWEGFNPFAGFGFEPFSFGGGRSARFQPAGRAYRTPELETVRQHILAERYTDAIDRLNRIPYHDADWYALYALADVGLGNRSSALDHAQNAVRLAPDDPEYNELLSTLESGSRSYEQRQSNMGFDLKSFICSNPCLSCCLINTVLNCCCFGGGYRYGTFCC